MRGRRLPNLICCAAALAMTVAAGAGSAEAGESKFAQLKGEFEFGMTPKQVMKILAEEIHEEYEEKIHSTRDAYRQDELRRERQKEIAKIKKTYIQFEGEKTGWDVSLIEDQFAHNTGESMLVRWENDPQTGEDRRRFFFFHEGKLYKMFIALNPSGEKKPFSYFQSLMQRRFGSGKVKYKGDGGDRKPMAIDWQSPRFVVRALNKLEFYGSFCLMIAERERAQRVAKIREAKREPAASSELGDVIADPDSERPELDDRESVVDRIIRNR